MTNESNALIATRLAGYEVQVSPAGKWYVVTDEGTRPMPDFETDWYEAMTTLLAICKSRGWEAEIVINDRHGWVCVDFGSESLTTIRPTLLSALAHCLLQIAEGEE